MSHAITKFVVSDVYCRLHEVLNLNAEPNKPKRKSDGGTTKTAKQEFLWFDKEAAAG
jgi:hypothetical protein